MSIEKKEVVKVVTMPKQAEPKKSATPTAQKKSIEEILTAQLNEINRKKKLADNRYFFLDKEIELKNCLSALSEEKNEGVFSSNKFVLKFGRRGSYRDDEQVFTIGNNEILTKFILFLQDEIKIAIEKIEKELLTGVF